MSDQPVEPVPTDPVQPQSPAPGPGSTPQSVDSSSQQPPAVQPVPATIDKKLPCPDMPETSIFNQPEFPHHTRPFEFTPFQVREVLDFWSRTGDNLRACCDMYGVKYEEIRRVQQTFPEISAYHNLAQEQKSDCYVEKSLEIASNDENDECEVTRVNKQGETLTYTQPNMVAVRRAELHTHVLMAVAERLNPRYRPKSETVSRNFNVNVNTKPVDLAALQFPDLS